jgi:hypothetical protein
MNIEDLGDHKKIEELHDSSNFDYKLPEFQGSPLFPIQRAATEDGRLIATVIAKVEAEIYLHIDHNWKTPEERWEVVKKMHADLKSKAKDLGFDTVYCVLPPEVAKSFGPRLEEIGWIPDRGWKRYVLEVRK